MKTKILFNMEDKYILLECEKKTGEMLSVWTGFRWFGSFHTFDTLTKYAKKYLLGEAKRVVRRLRADKVSKHKIVVFNLTNDQREQTEKELQSKIENKDW